MAHSLPLIKLAGLLIKTAAKPLSARIKHDFSRFESTSRVLIGIGQKSHQLTSSLTIWAEGYKVRSIRQLEEEKALKLGSEFVGESFLLIVSVGWMFYEVNNSNVKAQQKVDQTKLEKEQVQKALQDQFQAMDGRISYLEEKVKKLRKEKRRSRKQEGKQEEKQEESLEESQEESQETGFGFAWPQWLSLRFN
jgi:hypothetical protein